MKTNTCAYKTIKTLGPKNEGLEWSHYSVILPTHSPQDILSILLPMIGIHPAGSFQPYK